MEALNPRTRAQPLSSLTAPGRQALMPPLPRLPYLQLRQLYHPRHPLPVLQFKALPRAYLSSAQYRCPRFSLQRSQLYHNPSFPTAALLHDLHTYAIRYISNPNNSISFDTSWLRAVVLHIVSRNLPMLAVSVTNSTILHHISPLLKYSLFAVI